MLKTLMLVILCGGTLPAFSQVGGVAQFRFGMTLQEAKKASGSMVTFDCGFGDVLYTAKERMCLTSFTGGYPFGGMAYVFVTFASDRLVNVAAKYDLQYYDEVQRILRTRFGAPTSTQPGILWRKDGQKLVGESMTWSIENVVVTSEQFAAWKDEVLARFSVSTTSWQQELDNRRQQALATAPTTMFR